MEAQGKISLYFPNKLFNSHVFPFSQPWGNLLRRVQWKKIYEILKYCCCATKNEFNNTAWAQGFKKYLRASLFLHNLRVLVTFMIMSRRNVLLFFWHCFWKHNEILCFPVLKHQHCCPESKKPSFLKIGQVYQKLSLKNWFGTVS